MRAYEAWKEINEHLKCLRNSVGDVREVFSYGWIDQWKDAHYRARASSSKSDIEVLQIMINDAEEHAINTLAAIQKEKKKFFDEVRIADHTADAAGSGAEVKAEAPPVALRDGVPTARAVTRLIEQQSGPSDFRKVRAGH